MASHLSPSFLHVGYFYANIFLLHPLECRKCYLVRANQPLLRERGIYSLETCLHLRHHLSGTLGTFLLTSVECRKCHLGANQPLSGERDRIQHAYLQFKTNAICARACVLQISFFFWFLFVWLRWFTLFKVHKTKEKCSLISLLSIQNA